MGRLFNLQTVSYALQGFTRFIFAGTCQNRVVKIFPKFCMFFQINDDGRFFTMFINHEIDTAHAFEYGMEPKKLQCVC